MPKTADAEFRPNLEAADHAGKRSSSRWPRFAFRCRPIFSKLVQRRETCLAPANPFLGFWRKRVNRLNRSRAGVVSVKQPLIVVEDQLDQLFNRLAVLLTHLEPSVGKFVDRPGQILRAASALLPIACPTSSKLIPSRLRS